uniref:Uncharacterized protein n=1 Tax=Panagrolaimus superbus TaxID=310955 RepID=A0A914Y132_9BILA
MENLTGSFMDNAYKSTCGLSRGYSLNSLDGVLNTLIPTRIPGVTRSMLYIAERGTMAPIHTTNDEYFKECMALVPVIHKDFWESLLADKRAWNEYFGVDDRYRIPWKVWTALLPLKNKVCFGFTILLKYSVYYCYQIINGGSVVFLAAENRSSRKTPGYF